MYVTVDKAGREERPGLVQVTLISRKETYYEFLRSAFALTAQTGLSAGFYAWTTSRDFAPAQEISASG
ncbi:hypothetical protein NG2371_02127 [Nocardia gamkensis]|nr:hypothetical protein [Nocardia gamkensis]